MLWFNAIRERSKLLRTVPSLLVDVWTIAPTRLTWVILLRAIAAIAPVLALGVGGLLINAVNSPQMNTLHPRHIWGLLVCEALLVLVGTILSALASHHDLVLSNDFSLSMSLRLITKCNDLDLATFETSLYNDRLYRVKAQLASQVVLLRSLLQAMQQGISVVGAIVGSLLVCPGLIAVQLLGVLPIVAIQSHFAHVRYKVNKKRTPVRRYLDYLMQLASEPDAAKEVKLFAAGTYVLDTYRSVGLHHNDEDCALSARSTGAIIALTCVGTVVYYATYAILINRTIEGFSSLGRLVFLAGLLLRFRGQLTSFLNNVSQCSDQLMYVSDVSDFFAEPSRLRISPVPKTMSCEPREGIEFRNVTFAYPGSHELALSRVSFSIPRGKAIGLVGDNGSGKSTIVKLMTRLYDPREGQILYDGIDLRDYQLFDVRRIMTAVFQDYARYDLSAALNIALSDLDARDDFGAISRAARRAHIEDCIASLPRGFDQTLGRRFDGSRDLSGGQWQRLALARALMREAEVIILDEPTAAVDARTEQTLYDDVRAVASSKMILMTSHRLNNIRRADNILVLKNGSIYEQGTHSDLLTAGGEYANLFTMQAQGYR